MAGHSQFANIKHRKDAQDSKRAKVFIKIAKEITVAVKTGGADINSNSALRSAILKAKSNNMPKDNYMKAIKKASGNSDNSRYFEIRYEGYGPGGIAYIIECLTDNVNRTAANIRSYFNKNNGSLGQTNSVLFLFDRKGIIGFTDDNLEEEEVFGWVIENDAENLDVNKNDFLITSDIKNFSNIQKFLLNKNINDFFVSEIKWIPKENINTSQDDFEKNNNLIKLFNDDEDVQSVFTNIADKI